ncbi:hypothetical protein Tco_0705205 [Tanacetum coccineum]|uniref:Uncharacterized protein n=1 Tax=Tanacetum coccineum TaxID=301880 RepID=A0ABQ4Y448_9ASTR
MDTRGGSDRAVPEDSTYDLRREMLREICRTPHITAGRHRPRRRVNLLMGDSGWDSPGGMTYAYYSGVSTDSAAGQLTYGGYEELTGTLIQTQHQVHETRFQMQQAKIAALRETDRRRQAQMVETLCVMRDMRREMGDMQAELLANARASGGELAANTKNS